MDVFIGNRFARIAICSGRTTARDADGCKRRMAAEMAEDILTRANKLPTMKEKIGLIVDPPLRGSWNMAVDRALLESASSGGVPFIRIYQWKPSTISLGYFQAIAHRQSHIASRNCPVVRRATGGGAIIHDRELTYSIVLPRTSRWSTENAELFRRVHRSLIECLEGMGVRGCQLFENAVRESSSEPFLCFQRRANGDVVLKDFKIIGSAQRRLKNALLQHGSVLLGQSTAAPELPGVNELTTGQKICVEDLVSSWPTCLECEFDWEISPTTIDTAATTRAKTIERSVFGNDAWTRKR